MRRSAFSNRVHAAVRVQATTVMPPRLLSTALPLLLVATLAPTRVASSNCSAFQAVVVRDSYRAAANSDACAAFVTAAGGERWVDWPCDDDACAIVMRDASQTLPNCLVDGVNLRANVTASLARCASADPSERVGASTGAATAQLSSLLLVVGLSFVL